MNKERGFTLIELLVVIAIIGLLSSVILASLTTARKKARDARRISDMKQIQNALELYFDSNGSYPNPNGGVQWRSECSAAGAWSGSSRDSVIPGIVPTYMSTFPSDPAMSLSANTCCYLYLSNGPDYKLLDHDCSEINYASRPTLVDPRRDAVAGADGCTVDGTSIWAWAIWTRGAVCW